MGKVEKIDATLSDFDAHFQTHFSTDDGSSTNSKAAVKLLLFLADR